MSTSRRPLTLGLLAVSALLLAICFWRSRAKSQTEVYRAKPSASAPDGQPNRTLVDARARLSRPDVQAGQAPLNVLVTDASGTPIAGALVCAQPPTREIVSATTSACQIAGKDGIVGWTSAPAKHGRILASAAGFAAQEREVRGPESVTIALTRVSATVSGYVEDANGGPVVGALLLVLAGAEEQTVMGSSLSDSEGAFTVSASPGSFQLQATANGYATWQRAIVAPAAGVRLLMALGSSITGHVKDAESGAALEGVLVQARRHDVQSGSFGSATTSLDGAFTISNLGPGTHLVRLVDDEWAAEFQEVRLDFGTTTNVNFTATRAGRVEVSLSVGGRPCVSGGLQLSGAIAREGTADDAGVVRVSGLKPGEYMAHPHCAGARPGVSRSLSVRQGEIVRSEWDLEAGLSIQGQIVGGSESEKQGLTVRVLDPETGSTADCSTNALGEFLCGGLLAGQYDCWVNRMDVKLSNTVRVRLSNDSQPDRVKLNLLPSGTALVTLRTARGLPLDHVQLALRAPGKVPLPATPLGEGRSEFRGVPAGSYDLELEGAGPSEMTQRVQVEAGKTTDISLTLPTRDVEGRVLDSAGMPQPDTWVMLWGTSSLRMSAPEAEAMTDAEGHFFLSGLARKEYSVRVEGAGGTITRRLVEAVSPMTFYLGRDAAMTEDRNSAGIGSTNEIADHTDNLTAARGPADNSQSAIANTSAL